MNNSSQQGTAKNKDVKHFLFITDAGAAQTLIKRMHKAFKKTEVYKGCSNNDQKHFNLMSDELTFFFSRIEAEEKDAIKRIKRIGLEELRTFVDDMFRYFSISQDFTKQSIEERKEMIYDVKEISDLLCRLRN